VPTTVLVCGHVTLDRVGAAEVPGGSAWYGGRTLVALGATPRLLTAAGPDFPASALDGLACVVVPSPATTAFENTYGEDGARTQRVLAAAPPLDPTSIPEAWRAPEVLHLAPVLGEIEVIPFTRAVRAGLVGLGVQGLVRAVTAGGVVVPRRLDLSREALRAVDAAVVGEDEARGEPGLVARLVADVPVVAFTLGSRGCDVLVRGRRIRIGVHPADEVDPTGAGDAFAAAFFLALARGADPAEAARLGAAAGSLVVEGRGGEALPRVVEAWSRARRVPLLDGDAG
jgi:1D-myo-inositol 3-kinase